MTYLELVNSVLIRMREDTVPTMQGQTDNVALVVGAAVRDAAHRVASAHTWNALTFTDTVSTAVGQKHVDVSADAEGHVNVEQVYGADGRMLRPISRPDMIRRQATFTGDGSPYHYTASGKGTGASVRVLLSPTPDAVEALTVHGFRRQAELSGDDDALLIPSQPVLQYAMAVSSAERGELGGQPTAELFMLADRYLSDAIALDATMDSFDDIWYS